MSTAKNVLLGLGKNVLLTWQSCLFSDNFILDRRILIQHLNLDVLFVRHSERRKYIAMLDVVLRIY